MSSARALCGIARSRERRRRVTLQPFRETQRLVLTRSRTPPLTSRRANSGAGRGGNSPADSGCYGRQRSKRRAPLHAARASDKSPPPGRCATIIRASRTRPLSRAHAHCQLGARARDHRVVQQVGERVAFPPKRDIRGLRTPAEGMSVARMVVIRCFCVSAFLRFCVSAFRRFGVSFLRSEGQLLIQYGDHLSACTGEPCTCGFTDALASWSEHAN